MSPPPVPLCKVIGSYRLNHTVEDVNLVVYRGDYIKFDFNDTVGDPILQIPELSVKQKLTTDLDKAPYFKMKTMGRFRFSLGSVAGHIQVIEYKQPHYREVDVGEAAELLQNLSPLLLDVRTRAEFDNGHIKNAILIPVQELQKRVGELSEYKHQRYPDILRHRQPQHGGIQNSYRQWIQTDHQYAAWHLWMGKKPVSGYEIAPRIHTSGYGKYFLTC